MRRYAWGALLTVALNAAPVVADDRTPLTDRQIQARIEERLDKRDIARVGVVVTQGTVSLNGTVPSVWARNAALEQARKVRNVVGVANNLAITRGNSDASVAAQIASRLRRYVRYSIFDDVNIQIEEGVATLTGRVTMPYKATEMADLAARVTGVQEVRNDIRTLPVSIFDDRLRASLSRQIYRDPLFSHYAIQVNPPIHIVVENGRVTLTGAVSSEVERVKAEMIARSTFGVFNVENRLRIDS